MPVEIVPNEDHVSRHVDSPLRFDTQQAALRVLTVFEFPSADGDTDSLVWRKYKPTLAEVHEMGCARQMQKRTAKVGSTWTYEGAITTTAGAIRAIANRNGCGFLIEHDPSDGQGDHHLKIGYRVPEGHALGPAEKQELKRLLVGAFAPMERHNCVDSAKVH